MDGEINEILYEYYNIINREVNIYGIWYRPKRKIWYLVRGKRVGRKKEVNKIFFPGV